MSVETILRERGVTTLLDAREIYETAECVLNLWKGDGDEHIQLFRGEVVENDAAGMGRSDEEGIEPFIDVAESTVLRKVLHLDESQTAGARLAFVARERQDHGAVLRFEVNGVEVLRRPSPLAESEARQYWELQVGGWSWSRWYYVEIPPESLQEGDNEITVEAVAGEAGWQLMVADYRDFHKGMADPVEMPQTSSLSQDGGQTWAAERGEYVLRLALDRCRAAGELVSPVLDAAGEQEMAIRSRRTLESLRLDWDAKTPEGSQINLFVRTSAHPLGKAQSWSTWQVCQRGAAVEDVRGRYVQWKAELTSADRRHSPALRSVQLDAGIEVEEQASLRVVRAENARILRSSYDMSAEDYHCEILRELRQRCELDAVVAGAQTEFELIERLHQWAYRMPLGACYHFPWNVLDWIQVERDEGGAMQLNTYEQRRRDKMCLYPNVVLVAACLSYGIVARHLNFHSEGMTGHEIAEVWSNDYGKWVHLDATRDYYWHDPRTLVPLDTQEIHQVLGERLERVERWDRPYLFHQDLEALVRNLPIAFYGGDYEHSVDEGALFLFRSFCHFRVIPRFDVFSRPRPLPVSQGTEVWGWNGYLNWADDKVPPLPHFEQHSNRRADFYPTFNQTHYAAECVADERQLRLSLETQTPNFATFLAQVDGGAWQEAKAQFDWALHDGLNTLCLRTRNSAGVEGVISSLSVEI